MRTLKITSESIKCHFGELTLSWLQSLAFLTLKLDQEHMWQKKEQFNHHITTLFSGYFDDIFEPYLAYVFKKVKDYSQLKLELSKWQIIVSFIQSVVVNQIEMISPNVDNVLGNTRTYWR